ncbi:bifunctional metallophosphatase/5'-nucleotidase [Saccharopolyspora spinosa]|uniref:5'-nucleotidase n=1 Tax=Saccharopolyspora spinosa TaxID=60894 RepID=A0A2N3XT10_SACSN|nr:bifunctional metallophosphatase/5'-nucleotidase [Saccharopolyspora spinosa]PKW13751.1 5'-nucleotidase [Saccharopolyspora spinosa]
MIRHSRSLRRLAVSAVAVCAAVGLGAVPAAADPAITNIRLLSFNDLHGNLEPPTGSSGKVTLADGNTVDAGGAAYLAAHLKNLRGQVKNSMVLSTGDNIGASPLSSALFHDEPTIDVLNTMGITASVVGNHELDEGYNELKRIQNGGCHPVDGCQFQPKYNGANFPFLSANLTAEQTGQPAFKPYTISNMNGIPVGVIGATLEDLPTLVAPDGIKGLKVGPEIDAINRYADELDRHGVKAIVVSMHQGDNTEGGGPDDCRTTPGPARRIAEQISPKVDAVFTAHSHQQYVCSVTDPAGQPRPMIQGSSFGRIISTLDVQVDRRTKDIVRSTIKAQNHIVTRDIPGDRQVQTLVDQAVEKSKPIGDRQVGTIGAEITRAAAPSGESPLGNLIADAQLAATRSAGAQIALMNPGGVRDDLKYPSSPAGDGNGVVTYGEAYTVQPFANIMQTITLSGVQLKAVLEQQWQPKPDGSVQVRVLQPSSTLHYTWSESAPIGSKISGITIDGQAVQPDATYRVSANNFLAAGGDGFSALTGGTELTGGPIDLDAFNEYLSANPGIAPPATDRITRIG